MSITPRQSPYTLCPSPYCIDVRHPLKSESITLCTICVRPPPQLEFVVLNPFMAQAILGVVYLLPLRRYEMTCFLLVSRWARCGPVCFTGQTIFNKKRRVLQYSLVQGGDVKVHQTPMTLRQWDVHWLQSDWGFRNVFTFCFLSLVWVMFCVYIYIWLYIWLYIIIYIYIVYDYIFHYRHIIYDYIYIFINIYIYDWTPPFLK